MGKTKTAVLSGTPLEKKSGKQIYEEKKRRKKLEEKKAQVAGLGLKGGERIKVVGGEIIPQEEEKVTGTGEPQSQKHKKTKARGKKYRQVYKKIDKAKRYPVSEAIKLVKKTSYAKFNASVDLHLTIKKGGFSTDVSLPFFSGKQKRVEVANDKTIEKLNEGKVNFDILLATSDMMPKLLPFARLLGPRGLMPNPKAGTLIKDKKSVNKFSGNSLVIKTEKSRPIIHTSVGKVSQKDSELKENIDTIIEAVNKKQIERAYLTSTMSPSVKIDLAN
ncbi:hypothetical protein A2962_00300 [Candidatus Woesebacteria bacterium RIFCSPLOWO2_01_FULL_39_61]|uniref:Large ribosomal subunit protein uL1 n=1 Tax=Candidatus Woesebacteria bacterium RIFCSPHIGHO2_02_FULL_39_13 TaxID=1802505 RepID=A0A1F7YZT3_9BACT|nr:MAG: hypothetical protein A2692_05510 [Candidatus Woesebacteria bacterium RIFCSPHIGHO2_01_FULL_39_95]OGM32730.1 MAG: hypothetical protein A3D01_00980 [Candidatus Woesebacteria bacterium RIFCSPHIGHO2_02_FULL_39_13]OGM37903.1 MAG: hypothetical protein A3E13_04330 [Candidatus Woesebacteria bacterium RIFCSPHIGHO2_12_FULL_40_20]OGM66333.1 MAG: hypothetical protein A2962_00300 [Candidatus Woesebacteria bacterium RIFCSPLOWO2_01_FULL_39_61]OGM75367.1 MAG: hypothetical protein A3H19_02760 [Candidatus